VLRPGRTKGRPYEGRAFAVVRVFDGEELLVGGIAKRGGLRGKEARPDHKATELCGWRHARAEARADQGPPVRGRGAVAVVRVFDGGGIYSSEELRREPPVRGGSNGCIAGGWGSCTKEVRLGFGVLDPPRGIFEDVALNVLHIVGVADDVVVKAAVPERESVGVAEAVNFLS
jgi:hypothetical protein